MKRLLLILLLTSFCSFQAQSKLAVGYYPDWVYQTYPYSAIDYSSLTHIVHAFIFPQNNGSITTDSYFLVPELIPTAHQNGVKVLVGVGGYGYDAQFTALAANSTYRANFVNNLKNFILANGYDGADIDWEYPGSADKANCLALFQELRTAFDAAGIELLSAALPATDWGGGYDIPNLLNLLNWFGIMTYDYHGSWVNHSGHVSPLYKSPSDACGSVDESYNWYISHGLPANKMCLGMAFYGYDFTSTDLWASSSAAASVTYKNANAKIASGYVYNWDNICKMPYLRDAAHTHTVCYDDTNSIKMKCDYAVSKNTQGSIIWAISQDYDGSKATLLTIVKDYLKNPPQSAPVAVNLSYPVNGAQDLLSGLTLTWNAPAKTTTYNLQVSTNSSFTTLVTEQTGLINPSYVLNGLQPNTTYYWRVSGVNSAGTGIWSAIWSFTIRASNTLVIDDFEIMGPWQQPKLNSNTKYIDTSRTRLTISTAQKVNGSSSGKLDYTFTSQTGGVVCLFNTSQPAVANSDGSIGIWVYGDNSKNQLEFWFNTPGNYIANMGIINWTGWKFVQYNIASVPGTNKNFTCIVVRQVRKALKTGVLYLDDLKKGTVIPKSSMEEVASLPADFRLGNYPNPFNPATNIEFVLTEGSRVNLKVYDILGKEVASLINEQMEEGLHRVIFNASNLPSGIYIYRLDTDKIHEVRKMVLAK
ncbi:MAG: glycosyl hydrolase family 18 protein [Ignavibacteriales bacterium]